MDGKAFIKLFRGETVDEVEPYLWSDELILRYLNSAQVEFCRNTEGIEDSLSSICTVAATAGVVRLSPKILKIRAATLVEVGRDLDIMSVEHARRNGIALTQHPGVPVYLIPGVGKGMVQLSPPPASGQKFTLHLDVFRLPLSEITTADDELEVGEQFAMTLLQYVLFRAYARPDADTANIPLSREAYQNFLGECARAKVEQGRARKPNGATKFSW